MRFTTEIVRRAAAIVLLGAGLAVGIAFAQTPGKPAEGARKLVDLKGDIMYPIHVGDSTAICIVGNVAFYHNGAVITCDSAVRYSDNYMECYKNVLLNKGETYAYGDRADYNGRRNEANIYSPLIKVRKGDATLYTLNFSFNTKTNRGEYSGMGVVFDGDNVIESQRGFVYTDRNTMICVGNVQLKNDQYRMLSDSITYNTKTNRAQFFTRSYIWNTDNELLTAVRGTYDDNKKTYYFTDKAYVLTATRELWADSIDYNGKTSDAVMHGNIQLFDKENSTMGFGDYGQYWNKRGETLLTRHPSVLSFDNENPDTTYLRADTLFLYVYYPSDHKDTLSSQSSPESIQSDPLAYLSKLDSLSEERRYNIADSVGLIVKDIKQQIDSMRTLADSLEAAANPEEQKFLHSTPEQPDSVVSQSPHKDKPDKPKKERKKPSKRDNAAFRATAEAVDSIARAAGDSTALNPAMHLTDQGKYIPDSAAFKSLVPQISQHIVPPEVTELKSKISIIKPRYDSLSTIEKYLRSKLPIRAMLPDSATVARRDSTLRADSLARVDSLRLHNVKAYKHLLKVKKAADARALQAARAAEREKKAAARDERYIAKMKAKGLWTPPDSSALKKVDSTKLAPPKDTVKKEVKKTPPRDEADTIERVIRGFHHVKIWKKDMQAVADSLAAFSKDSTLFLYIEPIIWNTDNQITSKEVKFHTSGEEIESGFFTGDPIMASKVDEQHYNQVAGKTMTAHFRDNTVYRHDVDGNAQMFYWMQDDKSPDIIGFMYVTCGDISFYIADQEVYKITSRESPVWPLFPPDKIPADQKTSLDAFKWQPERRPTLEQVFDRTIRPSERAENEERPQPTFPIARQITERKDYLQQYTTWVDRHDILTEDVLTWVESVRKNRIQANTTSTQAPVGNAVRP